MANLLVPVLGEELFFAYVEILNQCIVPTDDILRDHPSLWFAERTRSELVAKSFREACDELQQVLGPEIDRWRWGRIHSLTLNHL